jgi:hypothetical protein
MFEPPLGGVQPSKGFDPMRVFAHIAREPRAARVDLGQVGKRAPWLGAKGRVYSPCFASDDGSDGAAATLAP